MKKLLIGLLLFFSFISFSYAYDYESDRFYVDVEEMTPTSFNLTFTMICDENQTYSLNWLSNFYVLQSPYGNITLAYRVGTTWNIRSIFSNWGNTCTTIGVKSHSSTSTYITYFTKSYNGNNYYWGNSYPSNYYTIDSNSTYWPLNAWSWGTKYNIFWYWQEVNLPISWPPVLELTATGSTYIREDGNGVDVIFLETNTDFTAEYYVYDDTLDETGVDYGDLGSFSWWLQAFNILNNEYFTFSAPKSYRVELVLSDPNDPFNTIYVNYPEFQYLMEGEYEEPDPETWNFTTSGWIPYWSGVKLSNFVPDPYGGRLYFELIAPNPTGTGTIELETSVDHFYSYDIDESWYGFDSEVDISYPYHQVAGLYNIRALYEYDNVVVYPFWTWYYNYIISVAESPLDGIENYVCDKDSNGIVTQTELDNCGYIQEGNFLQNIGSFLSEIKKFFRELMKIGDTPAKEWGFNFIPTANAELVSDKINLNLDLEQDNILTDTYYFIKWFIIFVFLLLWVIIIIIINKKE